MKYLVEVKPPKEKDIYLERSYATIIKSEAKFGYKENYPVILAEISETDFSYVIAGLEMMKRDYENVFKSFGKEKNNVLYENFVKETNQLQSVISILKHLST